MPAVITHKSIALLARERIAALNTTLTARVNANGPKLTDLERKLHALVQEAQRVLDSDPHPQIEDSGLVFAQTHGNDQERYPISRYAVMGSMGPDITAFAGLLMPGQAWVFDTVHKGTPDKARELVHAGTQDFIFEFWNHIDQNVSDATVKDHMRAFAMGHLCHHAADIISHPYINDLEWHLASEQDHKFSHFGAEGSIDAKVAQTLFGRDRLRSGEDWERWWPSFGDVPDAFYEAYSHALERTYTMQTNPRTGLVQYEKDHEGIDKPPLTVDFVRDGYQAYRRGVINIGYGYGFWSWFGWLSLFSIPLALAPIVGASLGYARDAYYDNPSRNKERAAFEFLTTPMALATPAQLGFGILLGTITRHGYNSRYWLGMTSSIVCVILAIVYFSTLHVDSLGPGVRWGLLFALPLVLSAIWGSLALADGLSEHHLRRAVPQAIFALPLAAMLLVAVIMLPLFFVLFLGKSPSGAGSIVGQVLFWAMALLWAIVAIYATVKLSRYLMRMIETRLPEEPEEFPVDRKHFVRLFDDTTLRDDINLVTSPGNKAKIFPSTRRPLLKLWWSGAGSLFVRIDRFQLVFATDANGANSQTIPAPVVPMTVKQFADHLRATLKDTANAVNQLNYKAHHTQDENFVLPIGAAFSDHGDGEETQAQHDAKAALFVQLPTAEADAFELYHSPRLAQAVTFGVNGAEVVDRGLGGDLTAPDEAVSGYTYIHDHAAASHSDALMSVAGDFGAILCMAAAGNMADAGRNLGNVHQVFRNWNLDRRRVNEWRTLVSGSAINDKTGKPEEYDDRTLKHFQPGGAWKAPLFNSSAAAFNEGEQTARQLGWIKTMREFTAVMENAGTDPLDTASMRPGNPSNQALSRAMAYLFDLPDPSLAPSP